MSMHPRRMNLSAPARRGGFTIVEVMTVVAIAGVMMMIALPAMRDMITTQRVKSTSYDINADLTYARAEAIGRGVDVVVASAGASTNWQGGWTITETGGNTVLRKSDARGSDIAVTASSATVTFERTGRATAGSTVQFSIVPSTTSSLGDHQKRCLRLDPSGRVRIALGACP